MTWILYIIFYNVSGILILNLNHWYIINTSYVFFRKLWIYDIINKSVIYIRKQHFRIFIRIRYSEILYKIQVKFTIAYSDENPKMLFSNVNHWNVFTFDICLNLSRAWGTRTSTHGVVSLELETRCLESRKLIINY